MAHRLPIQLQFPQEGRPGSGHWARLALLSSLPMMGAVIGAAVDERLHQGFTTWRAVCRSAGLGLPTLVDFTVQLMPFALTGMLLAGLALLVLGAFEHGRGAITCVAAHAGCAVTLPAGLVLCALLPPAVMLALDAVLAALAAWLVFGLMRSASRTADTHP